MLQIHMYNFWFLIKESGCSDGHQYSLISSRFAHTTFQFMQIKFVWIFIRIGRFLSDIALSSTTLQNKPISIWLKKEHIILSFWTFLISFGKYCQTYRSQYFFYVKVTRYTKWYVRNDTDEHIFIPICLGERQKDIFFVSWGIARTTRSQGHIN